MSGSSSQANPADQLESQMQIEVGDLMIGTGTIQLPKLPRMGWDEEGIEYVAADVVERAVLGALVQRENAQRIFEIGTFRGVTALTLAVNAPAGATVWTLDLPLTLEAGEIANQYYSSNSASGFHRMAKSGARREVGAAFRNYSGASRIVQLFGDVAAFDFSPYTPVDFFFVDGCHAYPEAKRDTLVALQVLKPGGLIVWHDFTWPSVEKAAREATSGLITTVNGTSLAFMRKP